MTIPEIKTNPFSPEDQARVDELLKDPWLKKKTNRARRIYEHLDFLNAHAADILRGPKTSVLDIGPGCGETLEIARAYGHDHLGIDAPSGAGGMGDAYLEYCRIMHRTQGLNVSYCGLMKVVHYTQSFGSYGLIVSRGSWEQSLSGCMYGIPHDQHHKSSEMEWIERRATVDVVDLVMCCIFHMLSPNGMFLLHMNGAKNTEYMIGILSQSAIRNNLTTSINPSDNRLIRFTKAAHEDSDRLRHSEADVNRGDDRVGVLAEGEGSTGSLPE